MGTNSGPVVTQYEVQPAPDEKLMMTPALRSIIERFRPITTVMSQNEIHARARIRTLGQI